MYAKVLLQKKYISLEEEICLPTAVGEKELFDQLQVS